MNMTLLVVIKWYLSILEPHMVQNPDSEIMAITYCIQSTANDSYIMYNCSYNLPFVPLSMTLINELLPNEDFILDSKLNVENIYGILSVIKK